MYYYHSHYFAEIHHSDMEPESDPMHKSPIGPQGRDGRDSKNSMRGIHSANTSPAHGRKKCWKENARHAALVLFLAGGLNVRLW
jgi:hypothetical protein